jgi:hypothetical protein
VLPIVIFVILWILQYSLSWLNLSSNIAKLILLPFVTLIGCYWMLSCKSLRLTYQQLVN